MSSDRTAAEFDAHHAALGGDVLAVPFAEHAAADALKRHCGVWAGVESTRLGARGRRSGVPALAVLGQDGGVLLHLDAEREGARCLAAWDPPRASRGVRGRVPGRVTPRARIGPESARAYDSLGARPGSGIGGDAQVTRGAARPKVFPKRAPRGSGGAGKATAH